MTLKNFFTAILLFGASLIYSQSYSIQGEIKDESDQGVAYANILLLRAQDSTIVNGTTSDDSGAFRFNDISQNNYILKTSFIGYETVYSAIELSADIVLDPIVLIESTESLSEVSITVKKPTFKRESDRLIFNVENTSLSEGNMIDVLRSTPSVLILNNTISVNNATPVVYINDRKVNLSSSEVVQLLEGTSASNIKSVEVITNPSARYDADSGIVLNIKMSKNLVTGYSGSLFSNYTQGVFPKVSLGSSNFFKTKKLDLYVNYSYGDRKIDRVNREMVIYQNERYDSDVDRNTWSETHTVNLGLDYEINANNRLSISSNMLFLPYFKYRTKNNTNVTALTPIPSNSFSRFFSDNLAKDLKHNLGFDVDYEHTFKADSSKLRLNAHVTTYDYRRKQRVDSDYFDSNDNFIESRAFRSRSDQATEIFTSQIDYKLPIGSNSALELGGKLGQVRTNSTIVQYNIMGNQEVQNDENTDDFDYQEDVYAGYVNFEKNGEKWNFNVGVRAEQTQIEGVSMSNSVTNTQDYLEWFPNTSISYNVSNKANLFVNYNRSISRPDYSDLNPFKFFLNDNTIVTGNPGLQPIFIDYLDLGVTFNNNFTLQVYYKKSEGNIFELPIQDNDENEIFYTPFNLASTIDYGIDFFGNINILDRWSMFVITSFYYTKDEGTVDNSLVEKDIWANYSDVTNSISFLKDNSLTANFVITYISANIQGFQKVDSRLLTDLSLRKTMLKGKGILSLSISDLLNDHDFFVRTKFLDQNSSVFSNLDNRYVRVGFRYRFGNTGLSTNEKTLSKEERDRLGNKH